MQAATDVRVEAAQAVASARIETTTAQASAEATRVSALAEIQHLRNQLEASLRENQILRAQFESSTKVVSDELRNATGLGQIDLRLQGIGNSWEGLNTKWTSTRSISRNFG